MLRKYNAKAPYSPSTLIMREGTGIASSAIAVALCLAKTPPGTDHVKSSLEDDNFWMNHPKEVVATHLRTPLLKLLEKWVRQLDTPTHTIYYSRHNFRGKVSQKAWPTRGLWLAVGTFCMLKNIEEAVMFGTSPRSKGICNYVSEKLLFHNLIRYNHVLAIVTWWSVTTTN